jgi:hypothetical protein
MSARCVSIVGAVLAMFTMMTNVGAGVLDSSPVAATASSLTPTEHLRGTEQTFLTFPEWFLVHSPAEYAQYVQAHTPSDFPFIGHIRQFWQSYGKVYDASNDGYPFNFGYHVMIMVIGSSTTIEYGIRSAYETIVGRISEATQSGAPSDEDRYGAMVAQDYVDFIRVKPWYEYDFIDKLKGLWSSTSLAGPDMIRKWERKYALTTEYGAKALYGWVIMKATRASYDEAGDTTAVILKPMPTDIDRSLPQLKILKPLVDGQVLVTLPRYQAFSAYANTLAKQQIQFVEIAGNRSAILVSVLTTMPLDTAWPNAKILFEQPVLTMPGRRRVALVVSVASLTNTLNDFAVRGVELEHIYDY